MSDTLTVFERTDRTADDVFFHKNDPNDRRLGDIVLTSPDDYASASVVLVGCPQDEGVHRNGGRTGAAHAPEAVRRCLYKLGTAGLEGLRLFDLGDTVIQDTLEETHEWHRQVIRHVLADGKTVVTLGGGNDVSYPDCAALADVEPDLLAFNVDAHFDVRADLPRNSGTPYRQLLEEGLLAPDRFHEVGSQPFANSPVYTRYLQEKGAHVIPLPAVRATGISDTFTRILGETDARAIFWGLDMDVVRASDAPGVSAPNPTGLFGEDLCTIAAIAGHDPRTRVLEISEVNPVHDIDQRTCRLAAAVIWHFLAAPMGL